MPLAALREVFSLVARDLITLGQGCERVRDRHLPCLVALETHAFQDFAAAKTVRVLADDLQIDRELEAIDAYEAAKSGKAKTSKRQLPSD